MRIIELRHDKLVEEGMNPERIVAYWAEKGIKVVWGDPAGEVAYGTKIPEGTEYRECPGCSKSVALHFSRWERNVSSTGKLGRWKPVCRSCAKNATRRACMECENLRLPESFVGKARTCEYCRNKPLSKRKSKCTKCKKKKPGTEFHVKKTGRFESWCRKCVSAATLPGVMEKYHSSSKSCRECLQTRPRADFPVVGSKRSHFCQDCYNARLTATERTCSICDTTRPVERFKHKSLPGAQMASVCADCHNRVARIKDQRRKARQRAQTLDIGTSATNSR